MLLTRQQPFVHHLFVPLLSTRENRRNVTTGWLLRRLTNYRDTAWLFEKVRDSGCAHYNVQPGLQKTVCLLPGPMSRSVFASSQLMQQDWLVLIRLMP